MILKQHPEGHTSGIICTVRNAASQNGQRINSSRHNTGFPRLMFSSIPNCKVMGGNLPLLTNLQLSALSSQQWVSLRICAVYCSLRGGFSASSFQAVSQGPLQTWGQAPERRRSGLRKQSEKFRAMTWPKIFCKVSDADLNSDLQLLAVGTETMERSAVNCCPLCLCTQFHQPLRWGSRMNGVSSSDHCNSKPDVPWGSTWRGAQTCCPSLQWTVQCSQSQLKFSQQWKQNQMSSFYAKNWCPAVVRSQAQHTHGSACPSPAQLLGAPHNCCMLLCIHIKWLERLIQHIPSKSLHPCPCTNKRKSITVLFCISHTLSIS